jgi:hypothetical protein
MCNTNAKQRSPLYLSIFLNPYFVHTPGNMTSLTINSDLISWPLACLLCVSLIPRGQYNNCDAKSSTTVEISINNHMKRCIYIHIKIQLSMETLTMIRRSLLTTEPRVQSRMNSYVIQSGRSGSGCGFSSIRFCYPLIIIILPCPIPVYDRPLG